MEEEKWKWNLGKSWKLVKGCEPLGLNNPERKSSTKMRMSAMERSGWKKDWYCNGLRTQRHDVTSDEEREELLSDVWKNDKMINRLVLICASLLTWIWVQRVMVIFV